MRGPAHVDGDQIDRFRQRHVHGIGSFVDHDAWIAAEHPGQLTIGGIHSVDSRGTSMQQAVDEAPHVAAEIGTDEAPDINMKVVQRSGKFLAGAGDKVRRCIVRYVGRTRWRPSGVRRSAAHRGGAISSSWQRQWR